MKLIGFAYPVFLLLLLVLIPVFLIYKKSNADLPQTRRKILIFIRMTILLLIVLALSGLRIYLQTNKLSVTFLIDDSESTPPNNREFAEKFIKESIKSAGYDDVAFVSLFGEDVYLDQTIIMPGEKLMPISTVVSKDRTNISQAINFGEALMPSDSNKRIVLISDGNDNSGEIDETGKSKIAGKAQVWTVPYPHSHKNEVLIKGISMPSKCRINEAFDIKVEIESTIDTTSKLHLLLNGRTVTQNSLNIHKGENIFYIQQKIQKPGTLSYEAIIEPATDNIQKNNHAGAVAFIQGKPKILYIGDFDTKPGAIASLLSRAGFNVIYGDPRNIPTNLKTLNDYSLVIFSNVSALYVSAQFLEMLKLYVNDLGGGFIMIGGMNSFGIGGYYGTPVEDILPVSMDTRKSKILPEIAMMLLIDKSGSMLTKEGDLEKIAYAREAVIATLQLLNPKDLLGVIAFDSASKWVVLMQHPINKSKAIDDIASIQAGGGTNLYPALYSSIKALSETQATYKHIIIMSDGRTEQGNFEKLINLIRNQKITLSTVSIGKDADTPFMKKLADDGKGRAYYTDSASLLPRIFMKDTFIASNSAYIEGTFSPLLCEYHAAISGIDLSRIPDMAGYCITSAKNLATSIFISNRKDPILALWRYGLGKSAAFTSSENGKWVSSWVRWKEFSPLWVQVARWCMPSIQNESYSIITDVKGDTCSVILEAIDDNGNFSNFLRFRGKIVTPDMESLDIILNQTGPGRYEGNFSLKKPGDYLINVSEKNGYNNIFAISVPYSREYINSMPNTHLLNNISDATEGRFNPKPGEIFSHPREKAYTPKDIWEELLIIALLLFPFDVGLRRVFLPSGWRKKIALHIAKYTILKKVTSTLKESTLDTMAALKSKKSEIKASYGSDEKMPEDKAKKYQPVSVTPAENPVAEKADPDTEKKSIKKSALDTTKETKTLQQSLSGDSISYLERLKNAKRKASGKE